MNLIHMPFSFSLGRTVITRNAAETIDPDDVSAALMRHTAKDWGDLCAEDWESNDRAVRGGGRILSAYKDRNGVKFWIITDAGHEVTTILLPEDY